MPVTIRTAGLLLLAGCWSPAAVEPPAARVRPVGSEAGEGNGDDGVAGEDEAEVAPEPLLNADPDGLDPYLVVTVTAPVTLVDDGGKPVGFVNKVGTTVEVRVEDGDVRRKVWCGTCSPAAEGWVRTQEIALATVQ